VSSISAYHCTVDPSGSRRQNVIALANDYQSAVTAFKRLSKQVFKL
jgi:hypothetical protein